MSAIRGTTVFSFVRMARRSAFDAAFSNTLMGNRCETPLRLSTRLSVRASNAIRSISSAMKSGTRSARPVRASHASCMEIVAPSSTVSG